MRITLTNKGANGNKILFFNIVVPISFNSLFVSHATGNNGPWNATIFGNVVHMDSNGGAQDLDLGDFATVTFTATALSNPGSITWNTAAWHKHVPDQNLTETFAISACMVPTISCPANTTVQCFSSVPVADFAAGGGTTSNGCGTVNVAFIGDSATNGTSSCNNVITRTYRATDSNGNTADCTQTITVNDTTSPTINNFPANTTVSCASAGPRPMTARSLRLTTAAVR